MKRIWPMIAVADVARSAAWYVELLDANNTHSGNAVFDQIEDEDGTMLLCLHRWGPSGARGDRHWSAFPADMRREGGPGLLLWFIVDDFNAAWKRQDGEYSDRPDLDNISDRTDVVASVNKK